MLHDTWTVVANGRQVGEFPEHLLMQWVASGQVSPNDLFWRSGMTAAAPAGTIEPFRRYFPPSRPNDYAEMRWILPVGRAPWAIAAGYLGLFSLLGVFGPFAIIAGILGVRQIQRSPHLLGLGRAVFGIVAGSIATIIVVALLLTR
jgi:hypothetical protein